MFKKISTAIHAGRNLFWPCLAALCLAYIPAASASNTPVAGTGCVDAASSRDLGRAPDHVSKRKVVSIGLEHSNRLLDLLEEHGSTASMHEFMEHNGMPPARVSERYILLVGGSHLRSTDRREMAAILLAKADRVPIVAEGFTQEDFKSLTGLSLKSQAAVVQFSRGGRAQTITLIHPPKGGHTMESALDAVNRAIEKNMQKTKAPGADPTRQAYAVNIWTVWLHTG
jgi:hypothetical protein